MEMWMAVWMEAHDSSKRNENIGLSRCFSLISASNCSPFFTVNMATARAGIGSAQGGTSLARNHAGHGKNPTCGACGEGAARVCGALLSTA